MKRKPLTTAPQGNPSVVLRAFAPETDFTLTLDGWLLLESMGNAYVLGNQPTMSDIVTAVMVMTDAQAVMTARKRGTFDALFSSFTAGRRPGEMLALSPKITAAFAAAVEPADSGCDPSEKKSSAAPAGG